MQSFADELGASLPTQISLPQEFRMTLEWMEASTFIHRFRNNEKKYGPIYPASLEVQGTSLVSLQLCEAEYVKNWTRGDSANAERLAPIIRTGGDGSYAALWPNDQGQQQFVHLGSGSGSTWLGVICDRPVDMLRLMAIGYDELCWPEHFGTSAAQAFEDTSEFIRDEAYLPPTAFQDFIRATFGVTVPATASEIVQRADSMDAATPDDPFWKWIRSFDNP